MIETQAAVEIMILFIISLGGCEIPIVIIIIMLLDWVSVLYNIIISMMTFL